MSKQETAPNAIHLTEIMETHGDYSQVTLDQGKHETL